MPTESELEQEFCREVVRSVERYLQLHPEIPIEVVGNLMAAASRAVLGFLLERLDRSLTRRDREPLSRQV